MPKPVRPFPLISYYWEPSEGFRWKGTRYGMKELAECDIDPEAVSVDSEAHDMENGRDGLDGNAPEKDTPEKDDRDAQPPVDTDNR